MRKQILVLCTGNSCRSQMAEGYLRAIYPESTIYSAGVETHGLNPLAVSVMMEDGIDISQHTSNHVDEFVDLNVDLGITVCDHAREMCPVFPGAQQIIHQNFEDPSKHVGPPEQILPRYRKTRDEIKAFVEQLTHSEILSSA